ncbi:MAG: hypothetical protein JKY67_00100 [Pseudomonadales bacterium]|nr:hypothetical protein [Pseudomonadales bacterium]
MTITQEQFDNLKRVVDEMAEGIKDAKDKSDNANLSITERVDDIQESLDRIEDKLDELNDEGDDL